MGCNNWDSHIQRMGSRKTKVYKYEIYYILTKYIADGLKTRQPSSMILAYHSFQEEIVLSDFLNGKLLHCYLLIAKYCIVEVIQFTNRRLRTRRALTLFNDVPLIEPEGRYCHSCFVQR